MNMQYATEVARLSQKVGSQRSQQHPGHACLARRNRQRSGLSCATILRVPATQRTLNGSLKSRFFKGLRDTRFKQLFAVLG